LKSFEQVRESISGTVRKLDGI